MSVDPGDGPGTDTGLQVDADLSLTVDGEEIRVTNEADRLVVACPSFRAARSLVRDSGALPGGLERLGAGVSDAGVPVAVRVRGGTVARLGPSVTPGPLSRAVGVAPARVRLRGILRALLP